MKDILKIGVTGSAGSGKSLVCQGFKRIGLVSFDCDNIARQVVEPGQKGYEGLVACFGPDVLNQDLSLDRAKLRSILVNHPELRKTMEGLLHPLILEKMDLLIKTAVYDKEPGCVVEVPLLFELGMDDQFDVTVTVVASQSALLERISKRDNVSRENAERLLDLQMAQNEKIKLADHVIENIGKPGELFESVENLYVKIKKEFLTIKS